MLQRFLVLRVPIYFRVVCCCLLACLFIGLLTGYLLVYCGVHVGFVTLDLLIWVYDFDFLGTWGKVVFSVTLGCLCGFKLVLCFLCWIWI